MNLQYVAYYQYRFNVANLDIMTLFIETAFELNTNMISLNHVTYLNYAKTCTEYSLTALYLFSLIFKYALYTFTVR